MKYKSQNISHLTKIALMASIMLILGYIERAFPIFPAIPGVRLGLANTVIMYSFLLMDSKSVWYLLSIKLLIGGLVFSGVVSMIFSAAGSVLSIICLMVSAKSKGFGFIGISVLASIGHMLGQMLISKFLLGTFIVLAQAPILLSSALISGILIGILTKKICIRLAQNDKESLNRLKQLSLI